MSRGRPSPRRRLQPSLPGQASVLLDAMTQELNRNFTVLKEKADPPPYFLSYEVTESELPDRSPATLGAITSNNGGKSRALDVSVRVGSPKLDNYHRIRGDRGQFTSGALLTFEDKSERHQAAPLAGDRPRLPRGGGAVHPHQDQYAGESGGGGRFRRFLGGEAVATFERGSAGS